VALIDSGPNPRSEHKVSSVSGKPTAVELCRLMNTTRQTVTELLRGSGLQIKELTAGLVICNPRDPERGQVHVAYADGQVSWERVAWDFWGALEGLARSTDTTVSATRIIHALTNHI
jgi:hypothetical protein